MTETFFHHPNPHTVQDGAAPSAPTPARSGGEKLQVVEIDAMQQSDVTSQWGVMSVPTPFIIIKITQDIDRTGS